MILPKRLMDLLRSRRFRIALACSPFVTIILLALAWVGINWYGRWKFDRTVDELVARGFPRTMKEAIGPVPADGENLLLLPLVQEEQQHFKLYCEKREISPGSWGAAMGIFNLTLDEMQGLHDPDPRWGAWANLEAFSGLEGNGKAKDLLARLEFAEPKRKALVTAMGSLRPGMADQVARGRDDDKAVEFLTEAMISLVSHGTLSLAAGQKNQAREDFLATLRYARNTQSTALPFSFTERSSFLLHDSLQGALREPPPGIWNDADLQEFDAVLKDSFSGELTMTFQRMNLPLLFDLAEQTHRSPPQRIDWKKWSSDWKWEWKASMESLEWAWDATRPQGLRDLEWAGRIKRLAGKTGNPGTPTDWPANPPDLTKFHRDTEEIVYGMLGDLHWDYSGSPWDPFQNTGDGGGEVQALMWSAMARCSIALDRHQLRHGSYPYSMDDLDADLKKDLSSDPLSKAPFIYRRTSKGGFELEGTEIHTEEGKTCVWERNLPE